MPWSSASCQRIAQRHHLSPGLSPGKLYCGIGVERSLPFDFENSRKSSVMIAQTVWTPWSSPPVSQQPLRYQPVIGLVQHVVTGSPNTFG